MTRYISCACVVVLATAVSVGSRSPTGSIRRSSSQPPTTSWPTYNGDYSGRRFSPLTKITAANVQIAEPRLDLPDRAGPRRRRADQGHAAS